MNIDLFNIFHILYMVHKSKIYYYKLIKNHMKKIFLFFIITSCYFNILKVNAGAQSEEQRYLFENIELKEELRELDISILKNEDKNYEKYDLLSQKTDLEIDIKENEKKLYCLSLDVSIIRCNSYSLSNLEKNNKIKEYNSEIEHLEKIKTIYDKKYLELKEEYENKIKQELENKQELEKEKQKRENYLKYLERADSLYSSEDYKNAVENYQIACLYSKNIDCYYWLWIAYYELANQYYPKINNSTYNRLFKTTIENSIKSFEKALELTSDNQKKTEVKTLIEQTINFIPNKEKEVEQAKLLKIKIQKENSANKKVEKIWDKLEQATGKYTVEQKQNYYLSLLSKLKKYPIENKDENIQLLIQGLIDKLIIATNSEEVIDEELSIFDRSEDFYKTTLQENTYSCEISATSDILSTLKKKDFTEDELIEKIDKSKFWETAKYTNWVYVWWNPEEGFVGYIDTDAKWKVASQRNLTGYWVYEEPIAKLYQSEWLKTEIINTSNYTTNFWPEQHLDKLLDEFTKGHYVQLWWDICTNPEYEDWELALADITQSDVDNGKNAKNECWSYGYDRKRIWYYEKDWKLIQHQGLIWEHNFYLLGYEWDIQKPVNIIVWDTSTGKHTYALNEWMRKWEEMNFRSIIIYSE